MQNLGVVCGDHITVELPNVLELYVIFDKFMEYTSIFLNILELYGKFQKFCKKVYKQSSRPPQTSIVIAKNIYFVNSE